MITVLLQPVPSPHNYAPNVSMAGDSLEEALRYAEGQMVYNVPYQMFVVRS